MKKLTDFLKNFAIDYVVRYLQDNKKEVIKIEDNFLDEKYFLNLPQSLLPD